MSQVVYFDSSDEIFHKFENYEIWPCAIVRKDNSGDLIYETCDFDDSDIAIWCVYGHFYIGGLECISDHETYDEAIEFMETFPRCR